MALLLNLRQLEKDNLELEVELTASQLDVSDADELIKVEEQVRYELEAQKVEDGILVMGTLSATLNCECARCLKPFKFNLDLDDWACHIPLEGEEKAVVTNDCVDLTPYLRE